MDNYLPARYTIPAAVTGDTFAGIPELSIKVNGVAPTNSLSSVKMQFKTEATATSANLELSSASGDITINDAANWSITVDPFNITLPANKYVYDIEFTDSAGDVRTYIAGTWTVAQDVTRA